MDISPGSVWTNRTTKHGGATVRVLRANSGRVVVLSLDGWSRDRRDHLFTLPLGAFRSQYECR